MDQRSLIASPYAAQYQQMLGALHQMQSAPTVAPVPMAPASDTLILSSGAAPAPAANPALTPPLPNGTFSRLTDMLHRLITGQASQQQAPNPTPWNNPNYPQQPAPATPPVQTEPAKPEPTPPAQPEPTPPAQPQPTPPAQPEHRDVTVRNGDSLSLIAKRELGDGNRWREIYELNKDVLKDPNRIFPGQVLKLPGGGQTPTPAPDKPEPAEPQGSGPVLKQGAKGNPVRRLQERLQELGFDPGGVDGDMGPKTIAAVKRFQERKGLEADGVVGPRTWKELGIRVEGDVQYPSAPSGGNSDRQVDVGGPQPAVVRQGKYIGARLADKFDAMVAAARADGIELAISSGYRTRAEQEALWRANPNPRYVARPGTSNHEKGDAIDFKNLPGAYDWLKRNASRFGLHNYDPEPWHYSLTGS